MSITLKLDASAVRELFKGEEATLELQRAVIAEICRQLWPNYVKEELVKQIDQVLGEARPDLIAIMRDEKNIQQAVSQRIQSARDNLRGKIELGQTSSEIVRAVDMRITELVKARVEDRVGNIQTIVDQRADYVVKRIEDNMERWINDAVRDRINQGVRDRLDQLMKGIASDNG